MHWWRTPSELRCTSSNTVSGERCVLPEGHKRLCTMWPERPDCAPDYYVVGRGYEPLFNCMVDADEYLEPAVVRSPTTEVERLLSWCHLHEAQVRWNGHREVVVQARIRGEVRQVARPSFVAAVHRMQELEHSVLQRESPAGL